MLYKLWLMPENTAYLTHSCCAVGSVIRDSKNKHIGGITISKGKIIFKNQKGLNA